MIEMTRIWERLYIGGRFDAERLFRSNPHGITSVISLCEDQVLRKNSGVSYMHIPIADEGPIAIGPFDAIIDAIAENIRWGTVLLHCGSGVSRAPVLAAAWMHIAGYKNIDACLREIAAYYRAIEDAARQCQAPEMKLGFHWILGLGFLPHLGY